jgi:hypothetical protein
VIIKHRPSSPLHEAEVEMVAEEIQLKGRLLPTSPEFHDPLLVQINVEIRLSQITELLFGTQRSANPTVESPQIDESSEIAMHPAQNKTTTAAAASCGSSISYNLLEFFARNLLQLLCKNANHGCAIARSLYCLNQHRLSICPHFGRSNDSRRDSQQA